MSRFSYVISLLILLTLGLPLHHASARTERCFPETGHCIDGRFLQFWEQHGGLPVFGYPISAAQPELNRDTGQTYLTQWFERNRFEHHPENSPPYDVLLGRLGDDLLLNAGRRWRDDSPAQQLGGDCLWFAQTGRNVCDQEAGLGFKSYWQSHGLEFDGRAGYSFEESLALFGLPLTEPRIETNTSGDTVLTQWFERARFEWHAGNARPYRVLLGLAGNEGRGLRPQPIAPPIPPPSAPPAPVPPVAGPSPTPPASDSDGLKQRLMTLVDALHQQAGCAPFRRDALLDVAAQGHADDIAATQRISHVGSDGSTLQQRLARVGYPYRWASESIAVYQTPEKAVEMWMDEPPDGPHRLNITNCKYIEVGFGLARDSRGRHWWVMNVSDRR
jgi:uncharacterized protein YkwD